MGRTALAIGGIALIGAGISLGFGWWWPTEDSAETHLDQQIHTVLIEVPSSDVRIRTAEGPTTTVYQRFSYRGRARPNNAFRVDGDQLVLSDCGNSCSTDFDVTVPRGTAVTGTSTSGEIRLQDTGPVDVLATSGDVDITLSTPQDVRARSTSGEIRVRVPHDSYRVQGVTTSGERRVDVVSDPAAPHVLDLTTTSGDVDVRER